MKKTRAAHLWIGLIASIFIFMESVTGLLMNEPWLIGQTQTERGNFQPGQFNQGGTAASTGQTAAQNNNQNQANGQDQNSSQSQFNNQGPGQQDGNSNGQFSGQRGFGGNETGPMGGNASSGSLTGFIKGLHQGQIGTMNIKWLIDLVAVAMMFLTGTGIYLSLRIIRGGKKKKGSMQEEFSIEHAIR
jgi:hypothetical protein